MRFPPSVAVTKFRTISHTKTPLAMAANEIWVGKNGIKTQIFIRYDTIVCI